MPHHVVVFHDPVEQAAVAVRRQLPLERQLEIAEFIDGDNVAGLTDPGERAVDGLPAGGQRLPPIAAPAGVGLISEGFAAGSCRGSRVAVKLACGAGKPTLT